MEHRFKKAWSEYFHAWIVCVQYTSNTRWQFVRLDVEHQNPIHAHSEYSKFNWVKI